MIHVKTTSAIANGTEPVLSICYDAEGEYLVMMGEEPLNETNTVMVSIEDLVTEDPSLEGIETLPHSWRAIRNSAHDTWDIGPSD
ncbi:MAG: hypothetical protein PUP46_04305 [Endozoicomonas sp. (ex Botrylloides leachii)]|nr:hypothetical protein [Endozoicomonas sp. (ex Botrylloides leachii)]